MRVAIIKLSALGDIVHAMACLQLIRQQSPDLIIDWVVDSKFSQLLECNSDINSIIKLPLKKLIKQKKFLQLIKLLFRLKTYGKYDVVIDLQGLIKSAFISRFLCSDKVFGFDRNSTKETLASTFYTDKVSVNYSENIITRNSILISKALNLNLNPALLKNKQKFLFFNKNNNSMIPFSKPFILIAPGASFQSKIFPKKKFIELTHKFSSKYLVIFGSKQEKAIAEEISLKAVNTKILGNFDIDFLKFLISQSFVVIGGDTGPVHLAWGLNRPSIAFFGPTLAKRNFYETDKNISIQSVNKVDDKHIVKTGNFFTKTKVKDIVDILEKLEKEYK